MKLAIRQNQVYFDICGDCREAGVDRCPLIEVGRSYHSFGAGILSHGFFYTFRSVSLSVPQGPFNEP